MKGEKNTAAGWQLEWLSDDEELLSRIRLLKTKGEDWRGALVAIFDYLGKPVEFDKLAGALTALLQLEDQPIESVEQNNDIPGLETSAGEPDAAWRVEKRIFLQIQYAHAQKAPLGFPRPVMGSRKGYYAFDRAHRRRGSEAALSPP